MIRFKRDDDVPPGDLGFRIDVRVPLWLDRLLPKKDLDFAAPLLGVLLVILALSCWACLMIVKG